jgi:hypothetical protein
MRQWRRGTGLERHVFQAGFNADVGVEWRTAGRWEGVVEGVGAV